MSYSLVVDKDVSISLRDGEALVADVFRPAEAGTFPVIITLGPYPKDVHFSQWNPMAWEGVPERGPYTSARDSSRGMPGDFPVPRVSHRITT